MVNCLRSFVHSTIIRIDNEQHFALILAMRHVEHVSFVWNIKTSRKLCILHIALLEKYHPFTSGKDGAARLPSQKNMHFNGLYVEEEL